VTSIGDRAFHDCNGLQNITVDNRNTTYESDGNCLIQSNNNTLILGCNTSVIPNGVLCIKQYSFFNCCELQSVTIPNSVTNIGNVAFSGCTSLTSITIPSSVTSIGDWVFKDCINLTSVIIKPILPPTIGINIFDDYINKIYVPRDSLSSYKIATNWSSYSSKIFAYYILQFLDYDDITVSSNQNVLYNNVSVQPADPVREGFTFAGWYTNKTYSQSFVFGNAVTQDTTIYAKFTTIAKLNIEGSEIEEPLTVGNEFEDLENLRQDNIDSKPGYTLIGWIYENEPVTQETVFNYTDDITITAIFNPNTYTVTFDIDYQGEAYPDPIELTYDDIIELLPNPTREGYIFKGWYIGDTKIEEGQVYNISNDSVLTARWEEIGYDYTWVYIFSPIILVSSIAITFFLIKLIKRKKFSKF